MTLDYWLSSVFLFTILPLGREVDNIVGTAKV